MREHLHEPDLTFGEIYLTVAHPGQVKGNHYHEQTTEWFFLIKGRGLLIAENKEERQREEVLLEEDRPMVIKVSKGVAHAFKNIGDEAMYLLAYADVPYDYERPDAYPAQVAL